MSEEQIEESHEAAPDAPAMGPREQLEHATRADGILAINPTGHLVRLRPGSVRLTADVERGIELQGLKDGWRLATPEDLAARTPQPGHKRSGA